MESKDELIFQWPETGKLTVKFRDNESAAVRFTPSPAAIKAALRKASPKAAYDDERHGHPHTHGK